MKAAWIWSGARMMTGVFCAAVAVVALQGCEVRRALSDGAVSTADSEMDASRDIVSRIPPRSTGFKDGGRDVVAPMGGADTLRPLTRELDLLFMIDNSRSMQPLQAKLAARLADFMEVLKTLPGGLPDVHVAVISSSLGAGAFSNIAGCVPLSQGNQDGRFQHGAHCLDLKPGQTFIKSIGGVNNFTGDINDVFTCLALIGDSGCGFEHQFESTRRALMRASNPADPDNGGFLRPNAYLSITMLTNEDDCSTDADSTLFDPTFNSVEEVLGGHQSYRCSEFGHLCDGVPPPHTVSAATTLSNCVSAEERGRLTTVKDFVAFVRSLKPGQPEKILVSAIAGPPTPYTVEPFSAQLPTGGREVQPRMEHSCMQASGEYADPGVRVKQWVDAFGDSGSFQTICADDFKPALVSIAQAIGRRLVQ